jgi:hypothetical protein
MGMPVCTHPPRISPLALAPSLAEHRAYTYRQRQSTPRATTQHQAEIINVAPWPVRTIRNAKGKAPLVRPRSTKLRAINDDPRPMRTGLFPYTGLRGHPRENTFEMEM